MLILLEIEKRYKTNTWKKKITSTQTQLSALLATHAVAVIAALHFLSLISHILHSHYLTLLSSDAFIIGINNKLFQHIC